MTGQLKTKSWTQRSNLPNDQQLEYNIFIPLLYIEFLPKNVSIRPTDYVKPIV